MAGARKWLTAGADLRCAHAVGIVAIDPAQRFVRIGGASVLVDPDTVNRPIQGCTAATLTNTPCTRTMTADRAASFSSLVRIGGRGVCLETATGVTDWSGLRSTPYAVASPGQDFVTTSE